MPRLPQSRSAGSTTALSGPTRRRLITAVGATVGAAGLLGLSGAPRSAFAQTPAWPVAKPIRMIVNFPAGGSPDLVARSVAAPLSQALGQQIVVENRSGAGGIIGADAAAKSPGDGYTILLSSGSAMSIVPLLNNKLPYDPLKDLLPLAAGARLELFLVARSDAPFKNFAEFIRHLKANPGRLTYGSPGNGTSPHIAGEMLKSQAGVFSVHIPYRGSAAVLQDLLGGQVDYTFDPGIAFQHVRSGRLRLLGVGAAKRSPLFPEAPTLAELGMTGFDAGTTHGFWVPAGTPADVIERLNREINRALVMPTVVEAIRGLGAEATPLSPRQFGEVIAADKARYARIIAERKITGD
jgi:tripartite-type tricarboxylate transporter receptor subunit TctC